MNEQTNNHLSISGHENSLDNRFHEMRAQVDTIFDFILSSLTSGNNLVRLMAGIEAHVKLKSLVINLLNDFPDTSIEKVIDFTHLLYGTCLAKLSKTGYSSLEHDLYAHLDGFNVEARAFIILKQAGYSLIPPSAIDEAGGIDTYIIGNDLPAKMPVHIVSSRQSPGISDGLIGPLNYDKALMEFNAQLTRWGGDTRELSFAGDFFLVIASRDKIEYNEFCPKID